MQMIDAVCASCGKLREDFLVRGDGVIAPCESCGGTLERVVKLGVAGAVRPDEIPGGVLIKHGICNPDGTPRRYDRWSDVKRAAKDAGYENHVTHITDPKSGSDKAKWTTRWVGLPQGLTPEDEAARIRAWHEHETQLQLDLQQPAERTTYDGGTSLLEHLES